MTTSITTMACSSFSADIFMPDDDSSNAKDIHQGIVTSRVNCTKDLRISHNHCCGLIEEKQRTKRKLCRGRAISLSRKFVQNDAIQLFLQTWEPTLFDWASFLQATRLPQNKSITTLNLNTPVQLIDKVLDVIGQAFMSMASSTNQIKSFKFNFSFGPEGYWLTALSPSNYEFDSFWDAWSKLKAFRLDMDPDHSEGGLKLVQRLITNAYSLKKLYLKDCLLEVQSRGTAFFDLLIATNNLPDLSHLVIDNAHFWSLKKLIILLKRFKSTLEVLSLSNIRLYGNWKDICEAMIGQFPRLRYIRLEFPQTIEDVTYIRYFMCPPRTIVPAPARRDFSFTQCRNKHISRYYGVCGVRYVGTDVDSALESIKKSLYPENSPPDGLAEYKKGLDRGSILYFNDKHADF